MSNKRIATISAIAALYTVVCVAFLPLSYGAVQFRVAEALTLLPVLFFDGIWGVTVGCLLTNIIGLFTGANILGVPDILFGTLATLIAAFASYKMRRVRFKGLPLLSALPPIFVNAVIIGLELTYMLSGSFNLQIFAIQAGLVALGQSVPCLVLGCLLVYFIEKLGLDKKLFNENVN